MTTKLTRRTFLAGSTALTALVLSNLPRPVAAQSNEVNLYSSRHYDTDDALYDSFSNGRVNLIEAEAGELIERIKSEGRNSPADILMTVDAGNLWRADQEDLFQPVASRVLTDAIPANLRHPQGHWFGFSTRARVIYYNKDKVSPLELSTYEDLADEKWRGKILIRSSGNIYNQSLMASLVAANGEATMKEWLAGFTGNLARDPDGNDTAQIKACAAGVGDIAIANSYYYVRLVKEGMEGDTEAQAVVDKVGIFFPNQGLGQRGTHVNISGGGVLANAPNKDAAVKFLEHLVAPQSQEYFAEGNNEYPVVADVAPNSVLQSFGEFRQDPINVAALGENQALAVKLMDEAGWR